MSFKGFQGSQTVFRGHLGRVSRASSGSQTVSEGIHGALARFRDSLDDSRGLREFQGCFRGLRGMSGGTWKLEGSFREFQNLQERFR